MKNSSPRSKSKFTWKHYFGMLAAFVGLIVVVFLAMAYYSDYVAQQEQEALEEFVEEFEAGNVNQGGY